MKIKKSTTVSFIKTKKLFNIHDIDVNKILVSKEESYGTKNSLKCFIGYNDDDAIRPLCTKLPQMIGYVKNFDSNKTIPFKVDDNKLLKKYNRIWEIISNLLNIEFDSEPVYGDNDKYIKTKIKMYEDRVNTNFQGKEVPEEDASYKCFSLIMLFNSSSAAVRTGLLWLDNTNTSLHVRFESNSIHHQLQYALGSFGLTTQ